MKDHVEFRNGQKMPILGLGTWQASGNRAELEAALNEALDAGYRLFDTAYMYFNEEIIGDVIQEWLVAGKVKREELFITTKLPVIGMVDSRVEHFLKKSLAALKLDYVDLYLIHNPIGVKYIDDKTVFPMENGQLALDLTTDHVKIWSAMEKQVEAGLTKAIGLSNFRPDQIERIVKSAKILPANLQSEAHVYFQQKEVRSICKKHGITFCAYAPFGSPGRKDAFEKRGMTFNDPGILKDSLVLAIAKTHGRTASQVLLRFLVQQDVVVIPKSTNPARLRENANIFDFNLSPTEVKKLEELDRGVAGRTFSSLFGSERHPESQ